MRMALQDGIIRIREMRDDQYRIMQSWGSLKWNRTLKELSGVAGLDLLNKLSVMVNLPPSIEEYRQELIGTQQAVDKLRMEEEPKVLIKPPIKKGIKPYAHQIRAYNMALTVFGVADAKKVTEVEDGPKQDRNCEGNGIQIP